ncbi:hypothetical protein BT96DRAFT_931429 [Gymnopus androsaceus JB14]|uniref:FAD-binding domain-containing protein n=1 Tax=Gymnopus androsaceus JB14 TaxID=1447944 RepID=A0A6A4ING8_9AGAR|nr:hypothetical protein BT96DRAFT_931429 [Gymnopus androsaceus JB14]
MSMLIPVNDEQHQDENGAAWERCLMTQDTHWTPPFPGKVTLEFKDGSSETGDFLVGADGLRSVVRKQLLPKHIPVDTTGRAIYGKTPITTQLLEKRNARLDIDNFRRH